ncbi:hypothetical protein ACOCJ7_02230 [Knoellia sp. CPCC 206453]|uniref:hypothetical protein n=1 Tax=Knoellia pratensis TaxID=3404796 RepID=UPI0036087E45
MSPRDLNLVSVDGIVPNPEFDHDPLPEQILGIALDQRAFGPRKLMVAFAAYDGRFLALLHAQRTDPIASALEGCLLHFDSLGRGGEARAAAVVLCDQPVEDGAPSPEFLATFEFAQGIARKHGVHLVDWIACDDDQFRCARLRTFAPGTETGWWDVPEAA